MGLMLNVFNNDCQVASGKSLYAISYPIQATCMSGVFFYSNLSISIPSNIISHTENRVEPLLDTVFYRSIRFYI